MSEENQKLIVSKTFLSTSFETLEAFDVAVTEYANGQIAEGYEIEITTAFASVALVHASPSIARIDGQKQANVQLIPIVCKSVNSFTDEDEEDGENVDTPAPVVPELVPTGGN